MKVNIIGAGIGGLTLGATLSQFGIEFEIFEKREELNGLVHKISFPMSYLYFFISNFWTLRNVYPIGNKVSACSFRTSFVILFSLISEVLKQGSTLFLILPDKFIDGFITDVNAQFFCESS